MSVDLGGAQGQGERNDQQDSWDCTKQELSGRQDRVGIVADGVGGLKMGGEASKVAVAAFLRSYQKSVSSGTAMQTLDRCLLAANDAVLKLARSADLEKKCASTLVAAAIRDWNLWWISAGDSRAYLIRGAGVHQLTADHTRAATFFDQVAEGKLSRKAAMEDPESGTVTSALGMMPVPPLTDRNIHAIRLHAGDRVLLCTDGVYHAVNEADIVAACRLRDSQACCDWITQLVDQRRIERQDNYTVVVMAPLSEAEAESWKGDRAITTL